MRVYERQMVRALVGHLMEDLSADAVLVAITRQVSGGKTETVAVPFGNAHACRGLADYVYDRIVCGEDEEEEGEEQVEGPDDE